MSATPGGMVSANLSGNGLAPGALSVMPMSKDFGATLVNTSTAAQNFTITNTGGVATGVPTVMLTGTDASQFTIVTNGCTTAIASGANCTIAVKFAPNAAGSKTAALTVQANPGGAVSPGLTGVAQTPASLVFDVTSKGYGTVTVGQMTAGTTFTLSNGGTQPTTAVSTQFTGNTADFQLTDNCATKTLGASCTYSIVFKPQSYGPKSATLTATAATGGMATVMVTGTGQDTVNLAITISGSGAVTGTGINCTSGTCNIPITRAGSSAPMVALTAAGSGGQTFQMWSGDCTGTVNPCNVTMSAARNVTASFAAAGVQPILWWKLDGSGTNSGTLAGYAYSPVGVSWVTGKFGMAAQYGPGAYGSVANSLRAALSTSAAYTISFWINATSSPNTGNSALDFWNRSTAPYGGLQFYFSSATSLVLCGASTTQPYLPNGSCTTTWTAPSPSVWHNYIFRYSGTGTAAGQGGNVDIYVDDVLVTTLPNDSSKNPIFSNGVGDTLYFGTSGMSWDDVRIYDQVFTQAQQCTTVIGGTWNGTSCALP